ncbi:alpha-amylase C-terminal beta-sheet domain-containing protein [Pseudanabaena sp. PCC 6802]|uniref:alpha-amylase C-terminal beta-sheet domain-containing protein n=1 Tax=Pseudanabaena sp. PCC 6802 TaxID=118173 RepID=UPI00034D2A07|nr:alpha-amylase C-terminal beta-sheet domain-containing protein [Pseudanabaena sp. PCC 6802]
MKLSLTRNRWIVRFLGFLFAFLLLVVLITAPGALAADYNGTGKEVILQGFHWTSYKPENNGNKHWYQIVKENAQNINRAGFDYVWFPPPSRSAASDNSYLPTEWYTLENGYGTENELKEAVTALKPTLALADIVINHRCGTATGGADFTNPAFGNSEQNRSAVVTGDDCNCGTGKPEERHHNGSISESNDAGRDLDHTNPLVQAKVKEFLDKLKTEIGFAGWRYDQVRGYNGYYVGLYNDASKPVLSVGEFWDDNSQAVVDWVDETRGKSMAFDFPTRAALVDATLNQNYSRLKTISGKSPGVIGMWPEMSVTFIENHDTEAVRNGGQKRFPDDKVMQGYVYILTHPGIPTVFWRHFFDGGDSQKAQIVKLIEIRKNAGITSKSSVFIEPNTDGKYAAIVDGKVAIKIGSASWSPGDGWKVALDGPDYAVWTKS